MATLVLTAAGNAIGGPIGGAIGAVIGQQIDRSIFAPKGRDGPRLKELDIQTSSYGSDVPAIFGAMRVAGTVIWATDLIERRVKSGGGKGRPSTTGYSYSVNMAVALSSRPVVRVGRIWADGNLLRGENGDFKTDTQFRFHAGHNDQPLDPLVASAESAGQCPAYRGLACVVFEDFQLADYGNRIPSLTFEIVERDTLVPVNAIFASASAGAVATNSGEMLTGYAMSGPDGRAALSPLLATLPVTLRVRDGVLELIDWWHGADEAAHVVTAAAEANQTFDRPMISQQPAYSAAQSLTLRHYDPERDFQAGVQTSQLVAAGRASQQLEIPAALSASAARRIADLQLLQMHRGKESWSIDAANGAKALYPGAWAQDVGGRSWRITELEHRFGTTKVTALSSISFDPTVPKPASSGRNLESPDLTPGQTHVIVIDLPVFGTTDPAKPQVAVFAAGTGTGWRRAALSVQQGSQLLDIGITALPATIGQMLTAVPPHSPGLVDSTSEVHIQLLHDGMRMPEIEGSPLAGNAGLCWIEGEFVRFGTVEALGGGRYRLSKLLRGCYGSDDAVAGHLVGGRFVLMDADSARIIDDVSLVPGSIFTVEALGLADAEPAVTTALVSANATAPRRPVHFKARRRGDGGLTLDWIRRSRIDFGWNDGVDQALVEDAEKYSVSMIVGGRTVAGWQTAVGELAISASEVTGPSFSAGTTLFFEVRQIGRHMMSVAATASVTLPI